jgi:uncharacterized protein (TIGR02265 family)
MHGSDADIETEEPPFGSPEELEQRLRQVAHGDMARGFVFNTVLDTVRDEAEAEALQRCLKATGFESFLPFFNYPVHSMLRLFYAASWELSGKYGGFEGAMRHLGSRTAPDFLESAVGRMLLGLANRNLKRLLNSIPVAYPTVYAHGTCTLEWTGPKSCRLILSGNVLPPPFIEAAMARVLGAVHPTGMSVRAWREAPRENRVEFSWE